MSPLVALALYPLWAVALTVGLTAYRLGRRVDRGLVVLCFCLAIWVAGLLLLRSPATEAIGERTMPLGMLMAGAFMQAGADMAGLTRRRPVQVMYAYAAVTALFAIVAPRLLYGPGARGAGPLFVPIALLASVGTALCILWLTRLALAAEGTERRRRLALTAGCAFGALGGGGVIGLRVSGLADVEVAAPMLFASVGLAAYAMLRGEHGRARDVVVQGFVYAVVTAVLSTFGLVVFFELLPALAPGHGASLGWLGFVVFFAALPLDPLRLVVVEAFGRLVFRRPIGVRDLAVEVEESEVRAEHAERLAEIGRLASAVAHEIRNPLGVIAAQAKLLERSGASPQVVAGVRAQVARARTFLDDLLRFSKPRPLDVREMDAGAALRLAASNVRAQFEASEVPAIEVGVREGEVMTIEADRAAFGDVATALIHNAAIAVLGAATARVAVGARLVADALEVVVEDNGPGVPAALEETLFQPFVTGRGRDEKHPGTGLGLAIAARWVERHGGTLRHERPSSGGARFVARWPRRAS